MLFAITCVDKPSSVALRQRTRPAHLDYLGAFKDQILIVGPLLADDGQTPRGTLAIMDFPDKSSAEAFAESDPYRKAGVFAEVTIRPFRKVLP